MGAGLTPRRDCIGDYLLMMRRHKRLMGPDLSSGISTLRRRVQLAQSHDGGWLLGLPDGLAGVPDGVLELREGLLGRVKVLPAPWQSGQRMFIPSFPRTMRPLPPHMPQLNISRDASFEEPSSLSVISLPPCR